MLGRRSGTDGGWVGCVHGDHSLSFGVLEISSADGSGPAAAAAAPPVSGAGLAVALALADGAAHASHRHEAPGQVWVNPEKIQVTRPSTVKMTGVCPR